MTKPRTMTISAPFDARHVGGVSIPGATNPIAALQRSAMASGLEPDQTPSHTYSATGNIEVPRRSHTIASTLSRPSLTLKTSISALRGRSSSHPPDTYPRKGHEHGTEPQGNTPQNEMYRVPSIRKKPNTSKLWGKSYHNTQMRSSPSKQEESVRTLLPPPPPPPPPSAAAPVQTPPSTLTRKTPTTYVTQPTVQSPAYYKSPDHYISPYAYNPIPSLPQPPPPKQQSPSVRPKRADSGVVIESNDLPDQNRLPGFQEILSVSSFQERMLLYKKTREYWATADHGLEEWVGRSRSGRGRMVVE
jgi:hypothetical protein